MVRWLETHQPKTRIFPSLQRSPVVRPILLTPPSVTLDTWHSAAAAQSSGVSGCMTAFFSNVFETIRSIFECIPIIGSFFVKAPLPRPHLEAPPCLSAASDSKPITNKELDLSLQSNVTASLDPSNLN
jgi:hypothetical protein